MTSLKAIVFLTSVCAFSTAATSNEAITVHSLLKQQFAVVSAVTSPIGPGLFLQKGDQLFLCFVAETSQSPTVATRYCKQVQ